MNSTSPKWYCWTCGKEVANGEMLDCDACYEWFFACRAVGEEEMSSNVPDFGLRPVAENFAHLWNSLRASAEALADAHSVLATIGMRGGKGSDGIVYTFAFEHRAIAYCECETAAAYRAAREVITKARLGVDT